jgi:hypothetical protein
MIHTFHIVISSKQKIQRYLTTQILTRYKEQFLLTNEARLNADFMIPTELCSGTSSNRQDTPRVATTRGQKVLKKW